jgi:hypothetical protein
VPEEAESQRGSDRLQLARKRFSARNFFVYIVVKSSQLFPPVMEVVNDEAAAAGATRFEISL